MRLPSSEGVVELDTVKERAVTARGFRRRARWVRNCGGRVKGWVSWRCGFHQVSIVTPHSRWWLRPGALHPLTGGDWASKIISFEPYASLQF